MRVIHSGLIVLFCLRSFVHILTALFFFSFLFSIFLRQLLALVLHGTSARYILVGVKTTFAASQSL